MSTIILILTMLIGLGSTPTHVQPHAAAQPQASGSPDILQDGDHVTLRHPEYGDWVASYSSGAFSFCQKDNPVGCAEGTIDGDLVMFMWSTVGWNSSEHRLFYLGSWCSVTAGRCLPTQSQPGPAQHVA